MAWVNETHPDNREAGWAVSASVTPARSTFTYLNSATVNDVFDPDFGNDTFHLLYVSSSPGQWTTAAMSINFGAVKKINKFRVRYGNGANWIPSYPHYMQCLDFYLQASFNGTSWATIGTYAIPPWGVSVYKGSSEYFVENEESYQYYRLAWIHMGHGPHTGNIGGFDLFSGSFATEQEEQEFTNYVEYQGDAIAFHAPNFTSGFPAANAFDGDVGTAFKNSDTNTYLSITLDKRQVVNFVKVYTPGGSQVRAGQYGLDIFGSNDNVVFQRISPGYTRGKAESSAWLNFDLRGINGQLFQYYRAYFQHFHYTSGHTEIILPELVLAHLGVWNIFSDSLPARDILDSATHPMLIASTEPRTCEALSGAVTSSEEGEGLYLHRIYREPLEVEGYCGAIGGEYDWEEEDFIIEREISAQAFISPFANFPMLARDINGLAGFGRQCHGDVTIRHSLEGSVGEFAMMDEAFRSKYQLEGHTGWIGTARLSASAGGSAHPGVTGFFECYRQPLSAHGLCGANVSVQRETFDVVGSSLQELRLSASVVMEPRRCLSTAIVDGLGSFAQALPSRSLDAFANVTNYASGTMTVPARHAIGQAQSERMVFGSFTLPARTVEAGTIMDILANASVWRAGYRMESKTSGNRFDTYLLKYEAPL